MTLREGSNDMLYKDKNKERTVNIVAKTNDGWLIIERSDGELFSNNVERKIVVPTDVYESVDKTEIKINKNPPPPFTVPLDQSHILKQAFWATLPWFIIFFIFSFTALPWSIIIWPFVYMLVLWRALSKRGYFK